MKVTITEQCILVEPNTAYTDEDERLVVYVESVMWALSRIQASLSGIECDQQQRAQTESMLARIREGMH